MRCLSIHLTDLCNSKCSFCVVGSPLYAKDTINYDRIVAFLNENAGRGYDGVIIHGGEPTIHPRFLETLQLIESLGYPEVHLQTNGILLANQEFARKVFDLGVCLFIVSLHGDTAALQDSQTATVGGFEKTIRGIRNVKSFGASVRISTVVTRQNVGRLSAISELCLSLGVDQFNFSNIHPVGSAVFGLSRIAPGFADVRRYLYPAVDMILRDNRRVALVGFPLCTIREKVNLQLHKNYDEIRMITTEGVTGNYDEFMNGIMRKFGEPCESCALRGPCGGVYNEYIDLRGWDEFTPVKACEYQNNESLASVIG